MDNSTSQPAQHNRSNSLASRLSNRLSAQPTPAAAAQPSSILGGPNNLPIQVSDGSHSSQPMQKKSYSAGPIIYPPKTNFDAIRGRFGLNQATTTTNYQSNYTPSSAISSLGIHRRGSIMEAHPTVTQIINIRNDSVLAHSIRVLHHMIQLKSISFRSRPLIPVGQVEDVIGLSGRLRLTKDLPQSPVSTYNVNNRYSSAGGGLKLLESQRHLLQAYEYLCHVGEAKDWLEIVLEMNAIDGAIPAASPSLTQPPSSPQLPTSTDPIATHQLHNYLGREHVPRIFIHPKLQYRHSDNINYFFQFLRFVRLPELFIFELVDLYNAKNLPKVIYCIHVLSKIQYIDKSNSIHIDDQLEQTNAGLVGKSMPNFGDINKELAKECKEEFEVEVESEPEQSTEGYIARVLHDVLLSRLEDNYLPLLLSRRPCVDIYNGHQEHSYRPIFSTIFPESLVSRLPFVGHDVVANVGQHQAQKELDIWAVALQAACRTRLSQRQFSKMSNTLGKLDFLWSALQAHVRGSLVRSRLRNMMSSAIECERAFTGVQALVRARLMTQAVREDKKRLGTVEVSSSVVRVQSQIRGLLERRRFFEPIHQLDRHESAVVEFQSLIRTRLVQAKLGKMVSELMASEQDGIPFQSVCRGALKFDSQNLSTESKALNRVEVTRSVGGLQAFVRAGLIRKKIVNQKKELDFIQPDVLGIQAQCRGVLARLEWGAWFVHVHSSVPTAIFLQSLTRGFLVRREFFERLMHVTSQYKALTRRTNVPISAIKAFLHLLNDSDLDFQEEIELSRLRTEVVRLIRDNQQLDGHVNELDTKIALTSGGGGSAGNRRRKDLGYRNSILAAANDPFAIVSSLVVNLPLPNSTTNDQDYNNLPPPPPKRSVMVTEKLRKSSKYGRGAKERRYLKDLLGSVINETVNDDNDRGILNIETDPIKIYRSVINEEETRTGIQSTRPIDVTFNEALADQETLALFIKRT
ncbi:hypothetical protein H4Q26_017039 [Puccinia striiformis f. sp. tritici PST-130]|nr:hypothetical protein H4Q26_017039 [Puccinia striiformis f. sp. tritici PST-130]